MENTSATNKPFGFCTVSSRNDATKTFNLTGGEYVSNPKKITITSKGHDIKMELENAIKQNDIIILDGSNGPFTISTQITIADHNKTIIGINNATLCTEWFVTEELKEMLDALKVKSMNTNGGGNTLPNGVYVNEAAEYYTRKTIMELTHDENEIYRNSGMFLLNAAENIIIKNIKFQGPGSIDVGGADLITSTNGSKHIWIDHCDFLDGIDGNLDIINKSDFHTISWCTFDYTSRSYAHQKSNLIGSNDNEPTGYLNTTFAFCWWKKCEQRMPMARVGKIHLLNNYYTCTGGNKCINPRINSEFLIEGNYFDKNVKRFYSKCGPTAVTWAENNHAESGAIPSSIGNTVTVPYQYNVIDATNVPTLIKEYYGTRN